MSADIQLVEGQYGDVIEFQINKADGTGDDLTVYSSVRLVVPSADFSTNLINKTQADAEITVDATGLLSWIPSVTSPIPVFGFYWIQIFREGGTNKPVRKFFLEVTREAQKT